MRSWSIFAGRFMGIELRIHMTFLLLLMYATLVLPHDSGDTSVWAMQRGLALVGIIFVCVVLHELGHAVASRYYGVPIKGIMLLPTGGVALVDPNTQMENAKNLAREARIAMAGPLVNAVLAAGSALVLGGRPPGGPFGGALITCPPLPPRFFWVNFFFLPFNLLPP